MNTRPRIIQQPEWATNAATKAYWASVAARIAERGTHEQEAKEALYCNDCGGLGVVRYDLPITHAEFGKLHPCPNPNCPVVAAATAKAFAKLDTAAQIPKDYRRWTFAAWDKLMRQKKDANGVHPMDKKRDALGAAKAFVAARENGYLFTLTEAAEWAGLPPPTNAEGEALDHGLKRCSIVYAGLNGVGKTSLAIAAAQALLDYSVPVVYVQMAAFFLALQERFKDKDSYEMAGEASDVAEVMTMYQQAAVLVIDEFPMRATPWQIDFGGQLINWRYANQLPTIITTNFKQPDELTTVWGLLVGSRVQSMAHWFLLDGKELRKRKPGIISR